MSKDLLDKIHTFLNENTTMNREEFVHELTSTDSEDSCPPQLGKRLAASSTNSYTTDVPRNLRLLKLARQSVLEKSKGMQTSSTGQEDELGNNTLSFQSTKKLLLIFLSETILNEKVNMKKFNHLPEACQILASIFMKEWLDFDICEETKVGSHQKHLFSLVNRRVPKTEETCLALKYSLLAECYMYGLTKQLLAKHSIDTSCEDVAQCVINTLYQKVFNSDFEQSRPSISDFRRVLEDLINNHGSLTPKEVVATLSTKLLSKMKELPVPTVHKFYAMKAKKILNDVLEGCSTISEAVNSFANCSAISLDLWSNYCL